MSFFEDVESFFNNNEYYGNSAMDYLFAVILFFGTYLFLYFVETILLGKLKSWIDKKDLSETAEVIIAKIQKTIGNLIYLVISISVAIKPLELNSLLEAAIAFLLYFTLSYYLIKILHLGVDIAISQQNRLTDQNSENINEFLRLILKTILTLIVFMWFLSNLGIDTGAFLASLDVFALAIAFALQNVISDIFAALVIYIDKPIEIDDYIQIGGDIGQVEKIGIRSTRIRALTGHLMIVSNKEIISSRIYNFKRMERRRVAFTLGISTQTPLPIVKEIPEIIENLIKDIPTAEFNRVFLSTLNDYTYDFEIVYYVMSRSYSEYQNTHQQVNLKIIEALEYKKVSIPYPTQTVIIQRSGNTTE